MPTTQKEKYHFANLSGGSNKTELWHECLGHLNYRDLKNSLPMDLHDEQCETCCLAKTTKTPVPNQNENEASKGAEIVFTNVVGPISLSSVDGFCYFVTFIEDCTSHAYVKFMQHRNQALQ